MCSRAGKGGRNREERWGVQHHGRVDSSNGAAISPRPLSGLVCATKAGATSPNLTYWLSLDRIYIQSQGREGEEGGTNQSQMSRSRQHKQHNEGRHANGMKRRSVPCAKRPRMRGNERGAEWVGFFYVHPTHSLTYLLVHTHGNMSPHCRATVWPPSDQHEGRMATEIQSHFL